MSRKNTSRPGYFRMPDDERLMRTPGLVHFINRPTNHNFIDAVRFGYGFAPEMDDFASEFSSLDDEDYDDDDDDDDKYDFLARKSYCGFPQHFFERSLPKPSRPITPQEADRNAKELIDEEENLKKKAEKKKQKKLRQKERRRLEKLEKENADKEKNIPEQVDPGSEKTKPADIDKNENKNINNNCSPVPPDPQPTKALVQNSEEEEEEDDEEEEDLLEPEELDMNSCFVSNAAAIAKRKLEKNPKPDKKTGPANSSKQHESKPKGATKPQKQIHNKEEVESEEAVDASDFIRKSMEFAVIGNQHAASGNLQMAVKYFTDAIKHNPKEYKFFGNRSFCYEKMLLYEKALTDAKLALSMNPTWIKGLYRKGKALVGLKRYNEARATYTEVLKLDPTCKDAAEELMRVQIMQLMKMGYTKEQSANALVIHGTVESALDGLSGLQGLAPGFVSSKSEFVPVQRNPQAAAKYQPINLPQNQPRHNLPVSTPHTRHSQELFPVWVGDLVPSITGETLHKLFKFAGPVHSVRVLPSRRCAFVNYTRKQDCEKAIADFHGYPIDGTVIVVRYPDRIHTCLGVSRDASTESLGKNNKQPDECYFWRTSGCIKNDRCTYRHIPENKGIDQH